MSQKAIREVLKVNPDGLTATHIAKLIGIPRENMVKQIKTMPDVYIDRWQKSQRGSPVPYVPVFIAVDVPENAPRPD